ncbi:MULTISPECIES: hypothetical protein [Roseateles]|uniref:Uncharacterized protein n=1 Tax=Roseateles albus TaxID=2987525 RepID=A0ABT5K932_9BURK|nr:MULTISPECIES: hypothetical protein [Roseateles]MCV2360678.1 hypothetical protein [Paucibacter sp. TC2R-5]MDC8770275.1 hypothetical protein [Roseateles albus]
MFNFIHPKPLLRGRAEVVQTVRQSALRTSLPDTLIAKARAELAPEERAQKTLASSAAK